MTVTFLSNLGHFQNHIAAFQKGSNGKAAKIYAFYHQVFTKGSVFYLGPPGPEIFDLLMGQKAYLPTPGARMGVPCQTLTGNKFGLSHITFYCTFFGADTYRDNFTHKKSIA
jgi:hypothetical protein